MFHACVRRAALGRPVLVFGGIRPPVGRPVSAHSQEVRSDVVPRPARPGDRRRGRAVAARRPPPLRRSRGRDRARPVAVPRAHRRPPDRPAARRPPVRHAREPRPPAGRGRRAVRARSPTTRRSPTATAARGLPDDVAGQVADYLAAGIDPARATIFAHTQVEALNQLLLPFLSLVSVAEVARNPTVKAEIAASGGTATSALMFAYPVHQAADILFCRANLVPVGRDQLPHLELTRTIARRFNERYAPGRAVLPGARGAAQPRAAAARRRRAEDGQERAATRSRCARPRTRRPG